MASEPRTQTVEDIALDAVEKIDRFFSFQTFKRHAFCCGRLGQSTDGAFRDP